MNRRRPLIVYIDTMGVGTAEAIAEAAGQRDIGTALICPPGNNRTAGMFERVIETENFRIDHLRRLIGRLDRRYAILGLHSICGPWRSDGFLHGSVAEIAAERGLSHSPPDALAAATNKFLTRLRLAQANVPDIPFGLATDEACAVAIARAVGYPVILKPLTGVGSSLIFRCNNDAEARASWSKAMRLLPRTYYEQLRMAPHAAHTGQGAILHFDPMKSMLVEQYLPGREASVECIVTGDDVTPLVVHDKLNVEEKSGFVLEHLLVAPPLRFTSAEIRQLRSHAVAAVRAIGLRNTFCHVELRWVRGTGPRILEVNPRIGAGCVADSIETFTNLDVGAARVSLILGEKLPPLKFRKAPRHAMIFLFAPRTGAITRLDGFEEINELPRVGAVRLMHQIGDSVGGDNEEGFIASIWAEAKDENQAGRIYSKIQKLFRIEVR
jgi:predicted ATP-grasp superfamily ATP-dependent carboligase